MDLISQNNGLGPNKKTSNPWLIVTIIVIVLGGLLLVLFLTGFINLQKTNKPSYSGTASSVYKLGAYQVSLPQDWSVSQESPFFSASDPKKSIRNITVTPIDYDQNLIDAYKKSPTNPPAKATYVYYARYLTAECYANESKGCFRIYYLWDEDKKKMAKLRIEWEKGTNNQAESNIEHLESAIFDNFKFNE